MSDTDQLAAAAANEITPGDVVGLGTGRAASRAIRAIGERARREGFHVRGVATSEASAKLAERVGIEVIPLDEATSIDIVLDGVDELAPDLSMLKGQGGAMTREKIVARASRRRVYLMQSSKKVTRLGERYAVPVEVLSAAAGLVREALGAMEIEGEWRTDDQGQRVITDNGNPILDCPLVPGMVADMLCARLSATAGVVGHGLFMYEADVVIMEDEDGSLEMLRRADLQDC